MKISSLGVLLFTNLMGSMVILSSSSWFSIWVGMELSSITAPPLVMLFSSSLVSKINSWKYYMVQCYSSAVFFLCVLALSSSSPLGSHSNFSWVMVLFSMLLKMGVLPFHGWFFHLVTSIPWTLLLIFSTIQKIGPMVIIGECSKASTSLIQPDLLVSTIISFLSISLLKINSIRFFMITSSVINSMWILVSTQTSKYSFMSFLVLYFFHLLVLFFFLKKNYCSPLESLFSPSKESFPSELMKTLVVLSMIGMPPLVGFFMKMSIIEQLILFNHVATAMTITLTSSIIMLVYLKIIISVMVKMRTKSLKQHSSNFTLSMSILFFALSMSYLII